MIEKIAIDMDGVLVDFLKGAIDAQIYDPETGKMDEDALLSAAPEFWSGLPSIVEGLWLYSRLYKFAKKYNVKLFILSHAVSNYAVQGKKAWVTKNLPSTKLMDLILVGKRSDKNQFADSNTLLIDDYTKNVEDFKASGGKAILFHRKDMKKTLEDLRGYLNDIE